MCNLAKYETFNSRDDAIKKLKVELSDCSHCLLGTLDEGVDVSVSHSARDQ